jgi:hypothetical protein
MSKQHSSKSTAQVVLFISFTNQKKWKFFCCWDKGRKQRNYGNFMVTKRRAMQEAQIHAEYD